MKKLLLFTTLLVIIITTPSFNIPKLVSYDTKYVEVSTAIWNNEKYIMVSMNRDGDRIKAKYFAAKDYSGASVYQRFNNWSLGKSLVLVSSGTYMNDSYQPVGLTIDNGIIVNRTLSNEFDGLVIVYATGGVVVSNIADGNLSIKCEGVDRKYDIRKALDRENFMECAQKVEATVFQTHLLAFKNELKIYPSPGCKLPPCERERRFLAVCKDDDGIVYHIIVHSPTPSTLYDGSRKVFKFLREYKDMKEVVFMINLDTGYQDVFQLYDDKGNIRNDIRGMKDLSVAVNLLVYYYQ